MNVEHLQEKQENLPSLDRVPPQYKLSNNSRQQLNTLITNLRKLYSAFINSGQRDYLERFEEFATQFFMNAETAHVASSEFARNKERPLQYERMRVAATASSYLESYEPNRWYRSRGREVGGIFADAPFVYALEYRCTDNEWRKMSYISLFPDFKNNVVLVDQLQGPEVPTREDKESVKKYRGRVDVQPYIARFQLAVPGDHKRIHAVPEEYLFSLAAKLAKHGGFRAIGLRKESYSQWHDVKQRARGNIQTPYATVSQSQKLTGADDAEVFNDPRTEEYMWQFFSKKE